MHEPLDYIYRNGKFLKPFDLNWKGLLKNIFGFCASLFLCLFSIMLIQDCQQTYETTRYGIKDHAEIIDKKIEEKYSTRYHRMQTRYILYFRFYDDNQEPAYFDSSLDRKNYNFFNIGDRVDIIRKHNHAVLADDSERSLLNYIIFVFIMACLSVGSVLVFLALIVFYFKPDHPRLQRFRSDHDY